MRSLKYLLVAAALFLLSVSAGIAEGSDLSGFTNSGKPIKVFIKDFANSSGQSQISADDYKKSLEKSIKNRKAVTFEIVQSPEKADVQISGTIKKYLYSKTDPINSYGGTGGLLLDAATTENYAEITVDFIVTDAKGKTLWNKELMSYVEHTMTPEESMPMVYNKSARDFLWRSFGKPKR